MKQKPKMNELCTYEEDAKIMKVKDARRIIVRKTSVRFIRISSRIYLIRL